MVTSCCVSYCTQRAVASSGVSFHGFPLKNPDLLKKWLKAINRDNWVPSDNSRICSLHFSEDDYETPGWCTKRRLKPDVIPHIFDASELSSKKPEKSTQSTSKISRQLQPDVALHLFNASEYELVESISSTSKVLQRSNPDVVPCTLIFEPLLKKSEKRIPNILSISRRLKLDKVTPVSNTSEYLPSKSETNTKSNSIISSSVSNEQNEISTSTPDISLVTKKKTNKKCTADVKKKKHFRYLGDFSDQVTSVDEAIEYVQMSKDVLQRKNTQIKLLLQENRRLKQKLENLASLMVQWKEKEIDHDAATNVSAINDIGNLPDTSSTALETLIGRKSTVKRKRRYRSVDDFNNRVSSTNDCFESQITDFEFS